ncbi:MAG TPA: ribosome small subunit-dependent GTPase A [Actinotalea sp.]
MLEHPQQDDPQPGQSQPEHPRPSRPQPEHPHGWDDRWAAVLSGHLADGPRAHRSAPGATAAARVCRSDRGACDVLVARGASTQAATFPWSTALSRAVAADPSAAPVAGDWAVVDPWGEPSAAVVSVLPRRTAVARATVTPGASHSQVLAANADVAAVVEGMVPAPNPGRIERLLSLAWASGARPVVVLTKSDLVADPDAVISAVAHLAPGCDVLATSATADLGLGPLRRWLADGATVALLGPSGAGKSTLLNALVGLTEGSGALRTQGLRADGKGRHTTVTRELHLVPGGGAVIDTPGLRTVGLTGSGGLDEAFPDVEELAASCRFRDCSHAAEPGCAVLEAVRTGRLPERRLDSYRRLLREAAWQEARVDSRVRAEQARRVRAVQRARRDLPVRRPPSGGRG